MSEVNAMQAQTSKDEVEAAEADMESKMVRL